MIHEFSQNDWQQTGDHFSLNIVFKEPLQKPLIQVYKYTSPDIDIAAQMLPLINIDVIYGEPNAVLLRFKEGFKGYIVLK